MNPQSPSKPSTPAQAAPAPKGTCQICGKTGAVVFDPEKAPPNRLCYRCLSEYGMHDQDEE